MPNNEASTYVDTSGTKVSGSIGTILKTAQASVPTLTGGK